MRKSEELFIKMLKLNNRKELIKTTSEFVNAFKINTKEMIKEIHKDNGAKNIMDEISWYWIRINSDSFKNRRYDLRNEESCKICAQLYSTEYGKRCINSYTVEYHENDDLKQIQSDAYAVAKAMSMDHKTLQQTFSRFVFNYLYETNIEFQYMVESIDKDIISFLPII